jgi:putative transcriptional regulator
MDFGIQLKTLRESLNLSQEMLARLLQVSFATVNRLEKGKTLPSYNTMKKIEKLCQDNNLKFEVVKND